MMTYEIKKLSDTFKVYNFRHYFPVLGLGRRVFNLTHHHQLSEVLATHCNT